MKIDRKYLSLFLVYLAPSAIIKANKGKDNLPIILSNKTLGNKMTPMWSITINIAANILITLPLKPFILLTSRNRL
jgi:hypothetical protein